MDSSFYFTSFKILKNFTNLLGGNKEGRKEETIKGETREM